MTTIAKTEALITPRLITWARERVELDAEEAAKKLGVRVGRLAAWESGDSRPSFRQAENLANKFNIPLGYLYLSEPPIEELPLADFRTIGGSHRGKPSPELIDVIDDALRKQEWYHEHLEAQEYEPVDFIGRFSAESSIDEIATDIRNTLGIDNELRERVQSWERFLTELIRSAEGSGILVLRSGVAGSNTHRSLNVSEFRGFTLSDSLAPLIFLNSRDFKAAQTFTLVHELAHLWTDQSGISNSDYWIRSNAQQNLFERKADAIAAEVLVPKAELLKEWNAGILLEHNVSRLARRYRVSAFVILRSGLDLELIDTETYQERLTALLGGDNPRRSRGGNFYANIGSRNSPTFTVAVVTAAAEGQLSYREAASLLNVVNLSTYFSIEDRLLKGEAGESAGLA